jgi:hypothetical protein
MQHSAQFAGPADQRFESRLQLEQGKRLREIVVGTGVKSTEFIGLRSARSENDQRDVPPCVGPKVPAERQPIRIRHPHINENGLANFNTGVSRPTQWIVLPPASRNPATFAGVSLSFSMRRKCMHVYFTLQSLPMSNARSAGQAPGGVFSIDRRMPAPVESTAENRLHDQMVGG